MPSLTLRKLTWLVVAASASYICICVIWSDSAFRHRKEEDNRVNLPPHFIPGMRGNANNVSRVKVPTLPQQSLDLSDVALEIAGDATDGVKTNYGATKQNDQTTLKKEDAKTTACKTTEQNGQKLKTTAKTSIPVQPNTPKGNKVEKPTAKYTNKNVSKRRESAMTTTNTTHQNGNTINETPKTTANLTKQNSPHKAVAGKTAVRPGAGAPTTMRSGAAIRTKVRPGAAAPTTVRPDGCDGCFLTDFPVLVDQSDICHGRHNTTVDVVFLITSAVTHWAQRAAIRQTWASVTSNSTGPLLRHVFVTGTTRDAQRMRRLEDEARHFRDVVVVGFHDSYMNLTLKTLASLRWVSTRCKSARFFVKLDDDVWVNSPAVVRLLNQHSDFLQHGLGGTCATGNRVNRNFSKWPVPVHLHPAPIYAPYCYGFAYAAAVSVAEKVVSVSRDIPFFHVEDAYVGMCLKRLKFGVRSFKGFRNFQAQTPCKDAKSPKLSTILDTSPQRFYQYWTEKCS